MKAFDPVRTQLKRMQVEAVGMRGKVTPQSLYKLERGLRKAIRDIVKAETSNTVCSNCCGKPDACTGPVQLEATEPMTLSPHSPNVPISLAAKLSKLRKPKPNGAGKPQKTQKPGSVSCHSKMES